MSNIDLVAGGKGQVSSYLKERKIVRYIKSKCDDANLLILHEDVVIDASDKFLNIIYDRMVNDGEISIKKLLKPLIKKKGDEYEK